MRPGLEVRSLSNSYNNQNHLKAKLFMGTTVATIILFVMVVWLFVKNNKTTNALQQLQEQQMQSEAIDPLQLDIPHGRVGLDAARNRLVGRTGGENGFEITYTIDPGLQKRAENVLQQFGEKHQLSSVPYMGAIVGLDAKTGAVRVMASFESRRARYYRSRAFAGFLEPLARNSNYPMASIQKIITASAALEKGNTYSPKTRFGASRTTFAQAMAKSDNTVFAKVARAVRPEGLMQFYDKYYFNRKIPFDLPLTESVFAIAMPDGDIAGAGSGLTGARVSPLHAALIAATVKNKGLLMKPYVVESISRKGMHVYKAEPVELARPVSKDTAKALARMMQGTTRKGGTGYNGFGKPLEEAKIKNAPRFVSKTGTVGDNCQTNNITWFVGYVDRGNPDIAFAVLFAIVSTKNFHAVDLAWDFFGAGLNVGKNKQDES